MKRKGMALLLAVLLCLPAFAAFAEEPGMRCVLDPETMTLSVELDAGVFERETEADLVVMMPGERLSAAKTPGKIFYAEGKRTDSAGGVSFEVDFQNASRGIYQIYLIPSGSGQTLNQTVTNLQQNFDEVFLEQINGINAGTPDGMKTLITGEDAQMVLENEIGLTPKNDTALYSYLVSGRPYQSLPDIQARYTTGILLALLQESDGGTIQTLLDQYGETRLGIKKTEAMYQMYLNSAHQAEICAAMPGTAQTPAEVKADLYQSTVLTSVKLSSWGEIPAVLKAAESYLTELDYTKVEAKAEQVGKAVAGKDYESVAKLQEAIKEAYNQPDNSGDNNENGNKNNSGSHSSGGGSGGRPGLPQIASAVPPLKEEYEKEELLFRDQADIPDFAKPYLAQLKADHIFAGDPDGSFRPDDPILRPEFCKVLVAAFQPPEADHTPSFSDVAPDAWYAEDVGRAAAAGYMQGKPDHTFGVDETLTRQDLAVILARIMQAENMDVQLAENTPEYLDQADISDYALEAVMYVTNAGVMEGDAQRFDPLGAVTRAQAAKVIGRLLYQE